MIETWVIPINLKYFDIYEHLQKTNEIAIKRLRNPIEGDIVYVYIASPESEIRFKGKVIKEKCNEDDLKKHTYITNMINYKEYNYFLIRIDKEYPKGLFQYKDLRSNDIGQVQALARASRKLKEYIELKEKEL